MDLLQTLPPWLSHTILGVVLTVRLAAAGFILARSGRTPVWALVILVPAVSVIGIWVFAFVRWPRAA